MAIKEKEGTIPFDPALVQYELSDKAKAIMDTLSNNLFIIESVSKTKDDYEKFLTTLLDNMHYGFDHKEFRTCKTFFKFRDDEGEKEKVLPYRDFIVNAIFWYPQIIIDPAKLDDSYVMPESAFLNMNAKIQKKYMDAWYVKPYKKYDGLSAVLHDCTFFLRQISRRFNKFIGLSMSIKVFMDLEKRIPEYAELLHFHVDETKQPAEIEKEIKEASQKQLDLILNDQEFNVLKALLKTNSLKEKQLSEVHTLIGLKPNDQGKTIPKVINTNYLIQGLNKISSLYIEAVSGRTAAIINKTLMGTAGHLLIMTAMMAASAKLCKTEVDCGSPNLIPVEVKNREVLKKINMRKYKRPGEKTFHTIDFDEDENLIGETIWMRSPVTCACKGNKICKECYGDLWYRNKNLNSAGLLAGFITMNPVAQNLLSAKHHQATNSEMIVFSENFYKYFVVDSTDIIIRNDIEDIENYKLIVRVVDIESSIDDDDNLSSLVKPKGRRKKKQKDDDADTFSLGDSDPSDSTETYLNYSTKKFYVAKDYGRKKKQQIEEFVDKDAKNLFMHDDFIKRMTLMSDPELGDILVLGLDEIDIYEFIFMINLENNGVMKPLKEIDKLISNKNHAGCSTYEEMVNVMMDMLIQANIGVDSVHGEMIIRQLIRRKNNRIKRPDFSKIVMSKDYDILTVNTALKYSPSLSTSLNTAYLRYQLVSMTETDEKTETSDFDAMFARTLNLEESVKHNSGRIA